MWIRDPNCEASKRTAKVRFNIPQKLPRKPCAIFPVFRSHTSASHEEKDGILKLLFLEKFINCCYSSQISFTYRPIWAWSQMIMGHEYDRFQKTWNIPISLVVWAISGYFCCPFWSLTVCVSIHYIIWERADWTLFLTSAFVFHGRQSHTCLERHEGEYLMRELPFFWVTYSYVQ